jgi:4-amino-4-deoxy-L-arabinose transferase-like glycosyltransferase
MRAAVLRKVTPARISAARRAAPVLFVAGILILLASALGANDLIAGDEGYYGVMARNILHDARQIVNPSLSPLGPPGDKPFLYPLLLAGALAIGGVDEVPPRLVNLLLAVGVAVALIGLGRVTGSPQAGWAAAALYLCSPVLAYNGRTLRAETAVACFGTLGAWALLRPVASAASPRTAGSGFARAVWWKGAALAGCLFGLGFLSKLWLVGIPIAGALAAALAAGVPRRRLLVAGIAFAVVGTIQLLLCAVATPEHLKHWLSIYFGFSLASRVSGDAFASYWIQPWSYYLVLLARSAALWLPPAVLGGVILARRAREERAARVPAALVLGWLLPLIPLSISRVKSGNYVFPLMPVLLLSAGAGVEALLRKELPPRRTLLVAAGLSLAFLLLGQVELRDGGLRVFSPVPALVQLAWVAGFVSLAAPRLLRSARHGRAAVYVLLALTMGGGLVREVQIVRARDHATGYQKLASVLEPILREVDPRRPCFFAPEWPSLSFYTFRTGRYWESPYVPPSPDSVRAALRAATPFLFVLEAGGGDLYGGRPDPQTRKLIEREGTPMSWAPDPAPAGLTVFLNASAGRVPPFRYTD